MNTNARLTLFLVAGLFTATSLSAAPAESQSAGWQYEATIYGMAAGMSGDVTIGGFTADADLPFDSILENLEMCAMGSFRAARGNWAFTTDIIYMGLGASKRGVSIDLDQWAVEPTVSYRFSERLELLAGARYNDIATTLHGPGVIPGSGTLKAGASWWDAIIGTNVFLPFAQDWAFTFRGDIGAGGSDLTWQAFPGVSWQFSPTGSLQAGYRWVYNDYETGSGANYFHYDIMSEGPQVGVRFRF